MQKISRILLSAGIFFLIFGGLHGQKTVSFYRKDYPRELITMHFSHECPFTGEVLWFKIYCSSIENKGKAISSLGFVELVSRENVSVIRKKIDLVSGEGSGELLIPENLETGIYYVIAYTNWMKNFGENSFFGKKILILNPYEPHTPSPAGLDSSKIYTPVQINKDSLNKITIITDKTIYSEREKVHARIIKGNLSDKNIMGNFSVSVYRREPDFGRFLSPNPVPGRNESSDSVFYLPDYKGIRLSGRVSDQSGNAVTGARLIMSLPGPGTTIESCITDRTGEFNFLLKPMKGEEDIVITLPDADDKISLEDPFWNGFRNMPAFPGIIFDRASVEYFREKFTYLQLEEKFHAQFYMKHAVFINKPDSSVFYQKPYQTLKLGNYIQLDSLGEYFHELIPSVFLSKRKGEYNITFIDEKTGEYLDEKPAVFFDGVLFDSYSPVANILPSEIDRISVLPAAYYYKDFYFGGIVDIHSRKSDFSSINAQANMTRFIYPKAVPDAFEFSSPDYAKPGPASSNPDFRYLLYWKPYMRMNDTGTYAFDFYTGDIRGTYIIKVTGITASGDILQAETGITVE